MACLTLQNGYPFPFPADLTESENEEYAAKAASVTLDIEGVKSVQWLHSFTVQFQDRTAFDKAALETGWGVYDRAGLILEAPTSSEDGYNQPAIIADEIAYCGFMIETESN